jgi:hypothetical protein
MGDVAFTSVLLCLILFLVYYLLLGKTIYTIIYLILDMKRYLNRGERMYKVMGNEMGEETVLTLAIANGKSLRTTVPISLVRQFKLRRGDRLDWQIKAKDNELLIVVSPLKSQEPKNETKVMVRNEKKGGKP